MLTISLELYWWFTNSKNSTLRGKNNMKQFCIMGKYPFTTKQYHIACKCLKLCTMSMNNNVKYHDREKYE